MTTLAAPNGGRAGELPLFDLFCRACDQWMAVCERWEHSQGDCITVSRRNIDVGSFENTPRTYRKATAAGLRTVRSA